MNKAAIFRMRLGRGFHFWHYLLNCYASQTISSLGERPHGDWLGRAVFQERNNLFQEEFYRLFQPFHRLCPECDNNCCADQTSMPFGAVDYLLLGGDEKYHLSKWGLRHTWHRITKLWDAAATTPPSVLQQSGCPYLSDTGCCIPLGKRSIICVMHICKPFCQAMTWKSYVKYCSLTTKYLSFIGASLWSRKKAWWTSNACGTAPAPMRS